MKTFHHKLGGINFCYDVSDLPVDKNFPLHMHDDFELLCVVTGKVGYIVEGHVYDLRPGSVMIMRSAESHKLLINQSERYERFVLNFVPEVLGDCGLPHSLLSPYLERGLGEKNHYAPEDFDGIKPIDLLKEMTKSLDYLSPKDAVLSFLPALLSLLQSAFQRGVLHKESTSADQGQRLINYVNNHLFDELSLKGIAEHMHLSESHLNRIFHASAGTSVYRYVLSKRLIAAQQLIMKGEGAQAASQKCGFHDYSAFYRLYKKRFHVSPAAAKPK